MIERLALDHLIVAAHTLEQGVAWCEEMLGESPGPGGKHSLMGTHNRLLKIETAVFPQAYLEIIAIDPDVAPQRTRWFGLDEAALQAKLRVAPRLVHWVARTNAMVRDIELFRGLGHDAGVPVAAARDTPQGRLSWRIALRDDGTLACGGALPTLIEWGGVHPTQAMAPCAITLQALLLRGLPGAMAALLPQGVQSVALPGGPMQATFLTPRGTVVLAS